MAKSKLKSGDLVKVITGEFRGLVDNIHHLEPKKERVYLAKATRKTYNKSPDVKKKSQSKQNHFDFRQKTLFDSARVTDYLLF